MNAPLFGTRLLAAGLIDEDQLRIALLEQKKSGRRLGHELVALGFAPENEVCDLLAHQLGCRRFDPARDPVSHEAIRLLPPETARRHQVLPVAIDAGRLSLATASPSSHEAISGIRRHLPAELQVDLLLAGEAEMAQAIDRHYGNTLLIDHLLEALESEGSLPSLRGDSPAVQLVETLLADAVRQGASDLHLAPEKACLRIRYRIDGILRTVRVLHKSGWAPLASRLKILAGLNIAETRAPQDGHFSRSIGGHEVDFRVSTQPTIHGENIVLRILDRHKGLLPLESLGLSDDEFHLLEQILARPDGLLLVTGPTGSGKTTTLYSLLRRLNHEGVNIMTLEDPVEYPLPLLRQTSITDNMKLDFASGIRAMLRQDPDIILIGEIRDAETAAMALRAALTGHRVLASLHAGSAVTALSRLRELGIEPERLHGNLCGIIAQRLLRRRCTRCTEAPSPENAATCPQCAGSGYLGRQAVLEILRIDPHLDALLAARANPAEILTAARAAGFTPLAEKGMQLVRKGITTRAEVARVIDLSDAG